MTLKPRLLSAALLSVSMSLSVVQAQTPIEEIRVTGSYLKRDQLSSGSPLTVISAEDLSAYGLTNIADVIGYLPFNSGSEFNADVFTQNLSAGTSNFNLRGLGLNSTLVLLNGRRQTVSGGVADDGSTFVDLNALVPLNAVGRVEILKDGAAALYGTDAVAGVVNVLTRTDVEGWELEGEFGTTTRSSQQDVTLRGLYGLQTERIRAMVAASHLRRSWLPSVDRDFTQGKGVSGFGQPGAFILLAPSPTFPGLPSGLTDPQSVIDPDCGPAGGSPNETAPGSSLGTCTFDFSPFYHLVPRERRWLSFASAVVDLDDVEIFADAGYAHTDVLRGTSPSFPILNLATVPADNPGNVFNVPALFLGRPLGANAPINLVTHASETWRAVGGARGKLRERWDWDLAASYSANRHVVKISNALADRFDAALNGLGGPNNDQLFNPFGSAALSQPGDATHNDPAVIEDFLSTATYDYQTSLFSLDGHVSGAVVETSRGPLAIALGGQLRRESIAGDLDDQFNAENYLFLIGGPDFSGHRTVLAGFGELNIPLTNTLDMQVALRHEAYQGGPDSTDPKIALLWQPNDQLSLRASFGTAFRAPSVFQRFSSQTVLQNIADPVNDSLVFRGVRTVGTEDLEPEQADVFNAGVSFSPVGGLTLDVDYWRFDYSNIIVKENAQAIIDANPFDPRVIREAGQVLRVDTNYVNAPAVETDGVDITMAYDIGIGGNAWGLSADVTYINKYLIQETSNGTKRDVSGSRNFRSFARSLPKWRTTLGATWSRDLLGAAVYVKTISGYFDDQNNIPVNNHVTVDVQLRYAFVPAERSEKAGPVVALGVTNLFDRDPPPVETNVGFDSKVHDPRGRVVYLRLSSAF
ncbi:MAG: TonB-dependent receptor [Rhodospirillaceae bacterium]|nr:TonB-dependent receptor [Rhodospirillaceae bacterium]